MAMVAFLGIRNKPLNVQDGVRLPNDGNPLGTHWNGTVGNRLQSF
jgi:hypothetical protein